MLTSDTTMPKKARWLTHLALQVFLVSAHGHALTQRGGTDKLPHRGYTGFASRPLSRGRLVAYSTWSAMGRQKLSS